MKPTTCLLAVLAASIVLLVIGFRSGSVSRSGNSVSPMVEPPLVESDKALHSANGPPVAAIATTPLDVRANDGFSSKNDANDRHESLNVDAKAAGTQVLHELDGEIAAALRDLASAKSYNPTIENLIQQWATENYSAALAMVVGLPAGDARDHLIQRVAYVQAQRSPFDAAQLVVTEIRPGPVQEEAAIMVAHQWALKDQYGAAAWVQRFPAGKIRDRAELELEGLKPFLSLHSN